MRMSLPGTPDGSREWRWANFPVPEGHLALMGLSLFLSRRWPKPLGRGRRLGLSMIMAGVALAAWATRAAGELDLEHPAGLVVDGPYRWSRHPMYVAWTMAYLGVAPAFDTRWPLFLSPVLGWWVRREARREETRLIATFGTDYLRYRDRVRRFV